jgi:ribonucleoside-diphosphate reductase alpha chain
MGDGLRIDRRFTKAGDDPFGAVEWSRRNSKIANPDGSVVFEMKDAEIPTSWSQVAADIMVSKYFRKAGVPQVDDEGNPILDEDGNVVTGPERSAKQVIGRLASTWRWWGERHGYFATADDAQAFEDELVHMLVTQMAAPNSPQWFNTGLNHAYGLTGPAQGFWYVDPDTEELLPSPDSYSRPAPHACFIQAVDDDLVNEGGIMDLWTREARLFKFGAGTGSNFSKIRAENEPLTGGGKSSGVMSFLKIGDRAAGAIKSGGTTRRAAKMVILDIDHPDVETFIDWKKVEEEKVRALIAAGYPSDFNGEAYQTVSGQNSNNSVRVTEEFLKAVENDEDWDLTARTDGSVMKTVKARDLWRRIAEAAWACADPGIQYDTTINQWHTSPAGGRINASNPCSEYLHLDNTACNLASLNLVKFYDDESQTFDIEAYKHAVRLWTIVLEISVTMAHFPSAEIAQGSYDYRTLGLGYANLGSLLMRSGIPYDSDEGRAITGALTAILTGDAYAASAEMASVLGPFPKYSENAESMLRVMRNHRQAAYGAGDGEYDGVTHGVMAIDPDLCPPELVQAARDSWDTAVEAGEEHGYRNAQATVLAPTGCLVGGSLVPTERGLVRLRSLGDPEGAEWQDLDIDVATDEGTRRATKFYVNGVEPVVSVETDRGYRIQGTPTHRIKVVTEDGDWAWKRFADVAEGDLVPLSMNQLIGEPQTMTLPPKPEVHWTGDFTTVVPREMTPELAELVGYFMGDGSLHAKGIRLCVTAEDFDVADRLAHLGKQLFGLEAHVSEQTGYTEVAFHSVPLVLWWEACGFAKHEPTENHSGKGYKPHVPDTVLHSNDPEVYAAFLRGLYEADGTVTTYYPHWATTDFDFSHDVQTLLLALGFPTTRKVDITGWGQSELAVLRLMNKSYNAPWLARIGFMGDRKNAAVRTSWTRQASRGDYVPVTREMVDRLAPENDALRRRMLLALSRNGLVSRRSAQKLYERTGDEGLGHLLSFFYDRVGSAELGEEQLTYDLSVPDNVTYLANGFVSHNTIGLLMDCDTTGVEPDFALVKFKKLAGGGYFKIANQSIDPALRALGYTEEQRYEMVRYVVGSMSLDGSPHVNAESLREKGFTDEDIANIEATLPGVFELKHAFNVFVVGEDAMQRLGFDEDTYTSFDFDMLRALGYSKEQIEEANAYICGMQTIEGAPHLADEHLPVFDCANKNGKHGERFIHHIGHIKAMAAAQPFISGAISKTINMPNEVTIEEIEEAYAMSADLGLKAMALYRDGSKASQPLSSTSGEGDTNDEEDEAVVEALESEHRVVTGTFAPGVSPTQAYHGVTRPRFLLPSKRTGWTQEARIGGHKVFLRTGEYADGTLGELFIDLAKEGATLRGILSCFAIAVSKGLQYGVPLDEFVDTFTFQTFEPRGMVEGHPNIKMANSIIDYVFRAVGMEYLGRDDLVQVKPVEHDLPEPPKGLAVDAGVQLGLDEDLPQTAPISHPAVAKPKEKPSPNGNGNGNGHHVVEKIEVKVGARTGDTQTASVQQALGEMMGDAPLCDTCGHITVRNGSCYRCLNCGNSMGCS